MKRFKENWEITQNWQLLFPLIGVIFLGYSSFKLVKLIPANWFNPTDSYFLPYLIFIICCVGIYYFCLKTVLYAIHKLENKWVVNQRWELIRIFIVFAFTGSSSVFVGRPIIEFIGITKDNLYPIFYWFLFIFISLFFYQILLLVFGWLFGQFKFFWGFEKKMLKRFGLGKFLKN
tara:strand:- start:2925 stop:3449 length:525 start_codon:yes stop_codon:yes gene_type:complete